jgi:hypothetical protein
MNKYGNEVLFVYRARGESGAMSSIKEESSDE